MADYANETLFLPGHEDEFWLEIDDLLSANHETQEHIDDALRTWLSLAAGLRDHRPDRDDEVAECARRLLASPLFVEDPIRGEYIRMQIIHSLLQEDDYSRLHAIACFLLFDGRAADDTTFPQMIGESCFPRLVDLVGAARRDGDHGLHRLLLQLMYEMAGMERLRMEDLLQVDDAFVLDLLRIIEGAADDVHDAYHYPTIRVLLVLNEQYMLASTDAATDPNSPASLPVNRVVDCLSTHGESFRTFGENIIILLNRETETSLQLLILKLLYLLFTTKSTHDYFYTNDLKVLLDVIIRNVMDLPDEKMSLRHTYLRVLYPLLAHTQLNRPPHYKRDEVLRVLAILRGQGGELLTPANDTTMRLVDRVSQVKWLEDTATSLEAGPEGSTIARRLLGISLSPSQSESSVSIGDVATVMEKPGIHTPSRQGTTKVPPQVPGPRRQRAAESGTETQDHHHHHPVDGPLKIPPKAPPPRRWGRARVSDGTGGGRELP